MKLQQEMMALYKREKVNPMSGCLPILVQIPVFFALYKVLFVTIEMRHMPFYGWIQDLSRTRSQLVLFNLFGLLPYDVPSFLMIGAWPIAWGINVYPTETESSTNRSYAGKNIYVLSIILNCNTCTISRRLGNLLDF